MTEREALKLALDALEKYARDFGSSDLSVKAMYVVREALAQPDQLFEENERLHVENRRLIERIETIGVPVGIGGFVTTTTQPEQEPVARVIEHGATVKLEWASADAAHNAKAGNLYTTPPQRTWQGLTADEIDLLEELYAPPVHPDFVNDADHCLELIRHVEAKLKQKNGYDS